ncbi:hypothetical protein Esti_002638 [Eimeria stiedai]
MVLLLSVLLLLLLLPREPQEAAKVGLHNKTLCCAACRRLPQQQHQQQHKGLPLPLLLLLLLLVLRGCMQQQPLNSLLIPSSLSTHKICERLPAAAVAAASTLKVQRERLKVQKERLQQQPQLQPLLQLLQSLLQQQQRHSSKAGAAVRAHARSPVVPGEAFFAGAPAAAAAAASAPAAATTFAAAIGSMQLQKCLGQVWAPLAPSKPPASAAADAAAAAAAAAEAAAGWRVVSADFAADGSLLLLTAVGGPEGGSARLLIADLKAGCVSRVYQCPEGAACCARFVARSTAECLLGGAEGDTVVRLWDLVGNRVIAAFALPAPLTGAEGLVAHPRQRLFLASCSNGVVLLFGLQQSQPIAGMQCSSHRPAVAFDTEGLIFAVSRSPTKLHLVNSELTDLQEFSAFDLSAALEPGSSIAGLCFSPDGESIAVSSNKQQLLLVNAFDGTTIARLCEAAPGDPSAFAPCSPSFSGDSRLIVWPRLSAVYAFQQPLAVQAKAADGSNTSPDWQQQQQQQGLNSELLVARHAGHSDAVLIAKASPTHSLVLTSNASSLLAFATHCWGSRCPVATALASIDGPSAAAAVAAAGAHCSSSQCSCCTKKLLLSANLTCSGAAQLAGEVR